MSSKGGRNDRFPMKRIQANMIATSERKLLTWLSARLPLWVTPDRLTALGVAGALLVLVAQIASRHDRWMFWLASCGLVIHWFGDSLDGSLARFRRIERPIYGYFLDHTTDALCMFLILVGFGLTSYVRMDVALFALVGYFFLCMYVFINNHVTGVMQLSFIGFGPTEIRLCLIGINTWMFFSGRLEFAIGGQVFSYYDGIMLFGGTMFIGVYLFFVARGIVTFRHPARSGAPLPPFKPAAEDQRADTKASSLSK